jgi:hypothetical protein
MQEAARKSDAKTYVLSGGPKGLPLLGMVREAARDPLALLAENALSYGAQPS